MSASLADSMLDFYRTQLGETDSLITLERKYFILALGGGILTDRRSWNDVARDYFASWNGSNPAGTLEDEAFKYYSSLSGLTPVASYSLQDHMRRVFATPTEGGLGGPISSPPVTDQLEAYYDAEYLDGQSVDGRVSKNLLTNNQATADIDTTGIASQQGTGTVARVTPLGPDVPFFRFTLTAGAGAPAALGTSGTGTSGIPVVAGRTYTAVARTKISVGTPTVNMRVFWFDSTGAGIGNDITLPNFTASSSFQNCYGTVTAPTNAAYAQVVCRYSNASSGDLLDFDNFGFWEGTSTDWVRPGKLNNVNLVTPNRATLETGNAPTTDFQNQSNATIGVAASPVVSGSYALSITAIGTADVVVSLGGGISFSTAHTPVQPNKPYVFTFKSRAGTTLRNIAATVYWYDAAGGALGNNSYSMGANTTGSYTQLNAYLTSPANAAYCLFTWRISGCSAGEVHYFDEFGIWEGYQREWVPPYRGKAALNDGVPVDFWRDLSGKSRHLVQTTAAAQARWRKNPSGSVSKNQLSYTNATMAASNGQWAGGVGGITITNDQTDGATSPGCIKVVRTSTTGDIAITLPVLTIHSQTAVSPGQSYTAVAKAKAVVTAQNARIYINWYKSDDTFLSTSAIGAVPTTTTDWRQVAITAVAPALAAYAEINLQGPGNTVVAGSGFFYDDIGLWPTQQYGDLDWIAPGLPFRNLLTYNQASVETDMTGLQAFTNCSAARSTAQAAHGNASLALTSTAAGNMTGGQVQTAGGRTAISPNTQYTAVCLSRAAVSARSARVSIDWLDSAGVFISSSGSTSVTNSTGAWTALSVTGTSPANAAYAAIYMTIIATGAASEVHYADQFGLTQGENIVWRAPVTQPNTKPCIQFDGVDDYLALLSLVNITQPITMFVVAKQDAEVTGNNGILVDAQAGSSGTNRVTILEAAGPFMAGFAGSNVTSPSAPDTNRHVHTLVANGASSQYRVDGNGTNGSAGTNSFDMITVGRRYAAVAGATWVGSVEAVLVYSGALTTTQVQQIERWLGGRFGVTVA